MVKAACLHQHEISGLDVSVLRACAVKIGCHLDASLCCKPVSTGRQAESTTLLQPRVTHIDTHGQAHRQNEGDISDSLEHFWADEWAFREADQTAAVLAELETLRRSHADSRRSSLTEQNRQPLT